VNYDLVICGVGGQGVLSIAWVVDHAAVDAGLQIKQTEVHGMAQRGGAVSACVRMADAPVASDLIADGTAALVLAVEPMESLRYARMLRPDGWIVTDITPLRNVASYPPDAKLYEVLFSAPRLIALDAAALARRAGTPRASNMVMLGAAAPLLPIATELLERHLRSLFAAKGERIAAANIDAFRMGESASRFAAALADGGVSAAIIARVLSRLDFEPRPVAPDVVQKWLRHLRAPGADATAAEIFAAGRALPLDASLSPQTA